MAKTCPNPISVSTTPVLSIIIVNWNTRALLLDCLSSIYATVSIPAETILVDNGSTDGSVEVVREKYPAVHILENPTNLGFAQAVNQGLKTATGQYYLILNSDTRLTTGAVQELLNFMESHPRAGLAGGQLINEAGLPRHSFDNFPTLVTELTNKSLWRLLAPSKYPNSKQIYQIPLEVESLVGAAMLTRAAVIKEVGLLDEDYFVFLEETDWCWRMKRKGWQIFYIPSARIPPSPRSDQRRGFDTCQD